MLIWFLIGLTQEYCLFDLQTWLHVDHWTVTQVNEFLPSNV